MAFSAMVIKNSTELASKYKNPEMWRGLFDMNNFDPYEKLAWMQKNWQWSVYASALYLVTIFVGQELMKSRKPFDLKVPLAIWNFLLAAFSIRAASVFLSELFEGLHKHGLHLSICGTMDLVSTLSQYWGCLFVLSKIIELFDTAFIVLRKKKLILLHWYHHVSVLICTWFGSKELISTGAWVALINCSVHSLMYTYFGLRTVGVKVPRILPMMITVCQISQMVVGLFINFYALQKILAGVDCAVTPFHVSLVFGVYMSYLVLFGNFFFDRYVRGGKRKID